MPILTLNLRGQDLIRKKTIRLHETVDLKYFKLMHVTTNLSGADVDPSAGTEQRQLYARLSFLNTKDVVYYESTALDNASPVMGGTSELKVFSIGLTQADTGTSDLFKTLSTRPIELHGTFDIELFVMDNRVGTESVNSADGDYALTTSGFQCRLRPLHESVVLPVATFENTVFIGTNLTTTHGFEDDGDDDDDDDGYDGSTDGEDDGDDDPGSGTVTVTNDQGTGAYTVAIATPGEGHSIGQTVTILGTSLGGQTPANDAVVTVTAIGSPVDSKPLTGVSVTGTPKFLGTSFGGAITNSHFLSLTFEYEAYNPPSLRT